MPAPKRVLCIMDQTVVGRASLSSVLPVLAVCGIQACGLPAALFSTHTGGFGDVAVLDTASFGQAALSHYLREGIVFDGIYIGYLCSEEQFVLAEHALEQYSGAMKIVDPALGDSGQLYTGLEMGSVLRMRNLCAKADVITPNITEAGLLTGAEGSGKTAEEQMRCLAGKTTSVLVTSVPAKQGVQMLGCGPEGSSPFNLPVHQLPQSYPGTGDLFTAALVGLLMRGLPLKDAASKAGGFVECAVRKTLEGGGEVRQGVWFEPCLPILL